jgi:hypothetical protein
MEIVIRLNSKFEHDRVISFYEQLAVSGHNIELVFRKADLKNPDEPPSLENLGVTKYLQNLVEGIIYDDGSPQELYRLVNNNMMERRK